MDGPIILMLCNCLLNGRVGFHAMLHTLLSHPGDRGDLHEGPDEEEEEEEEGGGEGGLVAGEDLGDDQRHVEKSGEEEEDEWRPLRHSQLPLCKQASLLLR